MRIVTFLAALAALSAPASAQYLVTTPGVPVTETFAGFTGAGFSPTPSAGQLSSHSVAMKLNDLSADYAFGFGEAPAQAVFARGAHNGGVTTGGVYAFNTGGGNIALGFQPSGSGATGIFTAGGYVVFRFRNDTGTLLRAADVELELAIRNDQNRSTFVDFFYDVTADAQFATPSGTALFDGTLKFETPLASTGAAWAHETRTARFEDLAWAPGTYLLVGFGAGDNGGSGSRDEFGVARLSVTGDAAPPAVTSAVTLGTQPGPGNDAGWYLLSAPVQGLTVGALAAQNLVQGMTGAFPGAAPNLYTDYASSAYVPAASTAQTLAPGRGFWWYLYDSAVPPTSVELPAQVEASGAARLGNVVVRPHAPSGFTLSGNPFEVPFDLGQMIVSRNGTVQDVVHVWNAADATYELRSRLDGDIVEPWQGFWFEGSNAAFVTLPASGRDVAPSLARTPARRLRLELTGLTASGHPTTDRALSLLFAAGGTDGWDGLDGSKAEPFGAGPFALAAFVAERDGQPARLAQDGRALEPGRLAIPVAFRATEAGTYTFAWPSLAALPGDWTLSLTDLETGVSTDLRREPGYTFAAEAGGWAERFTLVVDPQGLVAGEAGPAAAAFALSDAVPNPAQGASRVSLRVETPQAVRAELFDALGRRVAVVFEAAIAAAETTLIEADVRQLPAGVYVLRVEGETFQASRRLTVVR
ncbi:MAG: T9SS type A sorting domain-containing protein [Rubricoccaceae bacterium]